MMKKGWWLGVVSLLAIVIAYFVFKYAGARSNETQSPSISAQATESKSVFGLNYYTTRPIGRPAQGLPWITDLVIADLDQDGLKDIIVCEGQLNKVSWIRQVSLGVFEEQDIGQTIPGPAHVEVVDLDGDGHLDVLVASMGRITPTDEKIGAVIVLVNDGSNHFINRVLLDHTARVTYVAADDLNKDGRLDLVVGQFGYIEGEVRWMENLGNGEFRSHSLLDLPGTIHAPVADLNGDGNLDIVALVAQDSEEVHAFEGDGTGRFRDRVLYGSTNKDYGSSGLCIADVNRDGKPDIVYTNGDGFDYATPGPRPWHGIQWLENFGGGKFVYRRIADFPGAFSPVVADLDGDHDEDIVACSGFNDWNDKNAVSLMCFENDGSNHFTPRVLAHAPNHLIVVKAADLFNDGRIELVTGAFMFSPPYDGVSRITLWEHKK